MDLGLSLGEQMLLWGLHTIGSAYHILSEYYARFVLCEIRGCNNVDCLVNW